MSLEGLRAWIAEVERKLAKRTRVFLVLAVIAIGLGGAAIYLAIDARESSVSESDVQALQQQLETRIDELATTSSPPPAEPEAESKSEAEPAPKQEIEPAPKSAPDTQPETGKTDGGGTSEGTTGGTPKGATGGDASAAKLQELVEEAEKRAEEGK